MFAPQYEIFPYQETGARFVASRERAGLHDEMGVGKSATIIRAMEYANARRGMIIVPAMLRQNWLNEYRKFTREGLRVCKGVSKHDYIAWKRDRFDIIIPSYEQATAWAKDFVSEPSVLDFCALDEAHYLKNAESKRSKAILGPHSDGAGGVIEWAQQTWHVTGTPMSNDPLDAYTFLSMCKCIQGMSKQRFIETFFVILKGKYGNRHVVKTEMLEPLQQLLGNNAVRRMLAEVQPDLPPIFLTSYVVDGDDTEIVEWMKQFPGLDKSILEALEQGGLSFLDHAHVATLRRLIGKAKALPYADMLSEELLGGKDKQVVYGVHREALAILHEYLNNVGFKATLVNGDTSEKQRNAYVDSFQIDDTHRVFIANIRAAGVGVTLHRSAYVDIFESDWAPAGNAQAIKRIHRVGQKQVCHGRFITLANSFDENVNAIVAQKTAAIARIEGSAMNAAPLDMLAEFM